MSCSMNESGLKYTFRQVIHFKRYPHRLKQHYERVQCISRSTNQCREVMYVLGKYSCKQTKLQTHTKEKIK